MTTPMGEPGALPLATFLLLALTLQLQVCLAVVNQDVRLQLPAFALPHQRATDSTRQQVESLTPLFFVCPLVGVAVDWGSFFSRRLQMFEITCK
jgi:hypothetical protein